MKTGLIGSQRNLQPTGYGACYGYIRSLKEMAERRELRAIICCVLDQALCCRDVELFPNEFETIGNLTTLHFELLIGRGTKET